MVSAVRDQRGDGGCCLKWRRRCPAPVPGAPSRVVLPVRGPLVWRAAVRA